MPVERHRAGGGRTPNAAARFFLIIVVVACVAVAGVLIVVQLAARGPAIDLGPGAANLSPLERAGLSTYLTLRSADLMRPAGVDPAPIAFTVQPGDTATSVAGRLAAAGLVADADLLRYYMRYEGLDAGIEAGDFRLSATMTVAEIARALGDASAREAAVTIPEGWRLEQIADYLESRTDVPFGRDQFLAVTREAARASGQYSFLGDIPAGASLEGFLFPDTYRLAKEATASDLVARMLANFDAKAAPLRNDMIREGLTMYQALILASIVEREAAIGEERPLIASVYLNRRVISMKLDADPTVQYALGYQAEQGNWWKRGLTFDDLAFDSPYNTYLYPGLPPGPIASPGLDSIRAVVYPATSDFLYFRATCDGSGRHVFARTLEEQVANACN
ncbi:MAG: endolytic transglycosylase MltG [Chloroflexi bacterium]|nr:endolytic transglycosylase MltG [Chloroflexota bacterium]